MDRAHARRLVAQHAETSRLLGVDFVPVFRSADRSAPEDQAPIVEPKPGPAPSRSNGPPATPGALFIPAAEAGSPRPPRDPQTAGARLAALRDRYEREAPHRHFVTDHHRIVFGEGDCCARLMFVGEAPGAEEDRTGRPFVGPAGKLLDKMISAMGLTREQVYIANVLKTRPPNNATPTIEEITLCAPYLFEQIGIVAPEAIVALGLPASRALLNTTDSMSRLRGHWHRFVPPPPDDRPVPVMPTYHPAFLLRSYTPDNRAKVWADLQQVMERLGLTAPDRGRASPG